MYNTKLTIQPDIPSEELPTFSVGKYSYAILTIHGIPIEADSAALVLHPVDESLDIVGLSVDLRTSQVTLPESLFADVGEADYEIYFVRGGHKFWCGRGTYEVLESTFDVEAGTVVDDIFANKVVTGTIDITVSVRSTLIPADTSKYTLIGAYVVAPTSSINYTVTNIKETEGGFEVCYNATVSESGYSLRYTLMLKG
jgi:hypothetical protein